MIKSTVTKQNTYLGEHHYLGTVENTTGKETQKERRQGRKETKKQEKGLNKMLHKLNWRQTKKKQ